MIYLLIGQKGSGKSFIGELMETQFGIKFIRVEDWAKNVKKDRVLTDDIYLKEVFDTIEKGIRLAKQEHSSLTFESTGLTTHFDGMLKRLKSDFELVCIGVKADPKECLERIKNRNQSIHIPVSEEQIEAINDEVRKKNLPVAFTINNQGVNKTHLMDQLSKIITETLKI